MSRWVGQEYEGAWHVFPEDGPRHELSLTCWCNPEQRETSLVVHGEAQNGA